MDLGNLYRDIVETSPDGIWIFDLQGRTVYVNPRLCEMLGRDVPGTPVELEALSVLGPLDEVGRTQFAAHLDDLRLGETNVDEVECLWTRADGTQLWVLVRESPLHDAAGETWGILHRVTDYTERRRLFDELSSGRKQLSEAQQIAKIGSWEWDVRADEVIGSEALYSLYGLDSAGFSGTYVDFLEMVHENDRARVDEVVRRALDTEDVFEFDARIYRADGGLVWTRGRGRATRDAEGVAVRMTGTHQDITEAKVAERALRDLLAQNQLLQEMAIAANEAETLSDVLAVAQPLLLRHDDWDRGRGYLPSSGEPDGVLPLYLSDADQEADDAIPEVTAFERTLAARSLRSRGFVWDEETSRERPSVAFPVILGDDVVAVLVITASAPFERHAMIEAMIEQVAVQLARVAERERSAREIADARDAAMEGSRQKSEFLATMSHEIRTPLNGVIGLNDLLLRTTLDSHQQRLATGAQVASRSLLSVINDVLDFSKIEAGKLELESLDFDVRLVFDGVASMLAENARAKGVELLVSCHPDVPEMLNGDPNRLAQVLTNLGSNAVKFTDDGEVAIRATAERVGDRTSLRVEVVDTGVGVPPQSQQGIFDAFSQVDASTTRRYGGTGLGLAISSEIVDALGGEIGVESSPGAGSTFWFTAMFGPALGEAGSVSGRRTSLEGRRVLVVDDHAHNRLILTEQLSWWHVRSTTAKTATGALELIRDAASRSEPFDVVLLDMAMPDHDGLQLARMIHDETPLAGTRLVMLTSLTHIDDAELEQAGVLECLTKPVLAGELREALLRVLGDSGPGNTEAYDDATEQPVPDAGRHRVLVVEDNPVNQMVALGILEMLGYLADTAEDGQEAVTAWQRSAYDAILMDVQMPRMDGYAATRAIRELEGEGERIPVLAMTAAAVEGEREKCLAAGMDDFLTKPVNPSALGGMLGRWLNGADGSETAPEEVPSSAGDGVLDVERLDMLRDLDPGNTTYLDRAIGNFVAGVLDSVEAIRVAVSAADHEALTYAAHRLKGSALNLGLPVVGAHAYELEKLGDDGSTVGAEGLVVTLEASLEAAVTAVLDYQASYGGQALR